MTRLRKSSRTTAQAVGADAVDRGFGVVCERARDAADVGVGLTGEQSSLAVAFLPQPRHSEGEQRQRAALARDRIQHLIRQCVVLEREVKARRRLDEGAAKVVAHGHLERGELGKAGSKVS